MQITAYIIGGFYVFGGVVVLRQARMNALLDRALAGITLEKTPWNERVFNFYSYLGGVLTLSSGAALVLLSKWAVPLFLANAAAQAAYLAWASRWYKPEGELGEKGRRQTIQAAAIWTAVTAWVLWLRHQGLLT